MDEVLEFVSPSHSELEWLDGPQERQAPMNECSHTLAYQFIYEGQNITEGRQLKGTYNFLSCGCID